MDDASRGHPVDRSALARRDGLAAIWMLVKDRFLE